MTFRRVLITLALLILPSTAHAQGVVTGHILLPSGQPPANGKVCATLLNFKPQVPRTSSGAVVQQTNFCTPSSPTDGSFSIPLFTNSSILPAQTLWRFDFMVNGIQQSSATYNVNTTPFNLDTAAPTVTFPGPSGYVLGAKTFEFAQVTPATTWVIPHTFGDKNVVFNCYDTNNKFLEPDTVVETDQNTLTLTFVVPQAGNCTVMTGGNVALTNAPANAVITNPNAAQVITNQPLTVQNALFATGGGTLGGFSSINSTLYVGGPLVTGDIGAQINAAYALLPSTGGSIVVMPQPSGACYLYSTPIVMTTVGKMALLQGGAVSSTSGTNTGGACLQYTHVTGSPAITIDWCPGSGCSYINAGGVRNLALLDSATEGSSTPCETNGGCGVSTVTGLQIGGTNSGALLSDWPDLTVKGFGVGVDMTGISGIGWAPVFYNNSYAYNTIGFRANGSEGITFLGGNISVNGRGIKLQNTASQGATNIKAIGVHFDSNVVMGIDGTAGGTCGVIDLVADHFENLGTSSTAYVNCAGGGGQVNITGGEAFDDNTTGSASPYWFTAYVLNASGLSLFQSPGRPAPTSLFVLGSATGHADVVNFAPGVLTGDLGLANTVHTIFGPGITPQISSPHYQSHQGNLPSAAWVTGGGSSSGSCTLGPTDTDTVGTVTCTTGSSATGVSGSIQLNFFYAFTGTKAGCQWTLNQTGSGTWPSTTTLADAGTTNNIATVQWATNGAALPFSKTLSLNYACVGR